MVPHEADELRGSHTKATLSTCGVNVSTSLGTISGSLVDTVSKKSYLSLSANPCFESFERM